MGQTFVFIYIVFDYRRHLIRSNGNAKNKVKISAMIDAEKKTKKGLTSSPKYL